MKPLQLWFARPQEADFSRIRQKFIPFLTSEERIRHDGFHRASDRELYLLAHSLMRVALLPHAEKPMKDWVFTREEKGKPRVDLGMGLFPEFSLSHTAGMAVCAVSVSSRIGIDVEPVNRGKEALQIASRWFTKSEQRFLEGLRPSFREEVAIWMWTAKEALLKATGEGIQSLSSVSVRWPTEEGGDAATFDTESPWALMRFRLGDQFLGAIAQEGKMDRGVLPHAFQLDGALETPLRVLSTQTDGVLHVATMGPL